MALTIRKLIFADRSAWSLGKPINFTNFTSRINKLKLFLYVQAIKGTQRAKGVINYLYNKHLD